MWRLRSGASFVYSVPHARDQESISRRAGATLPNMKSKYLHSLSFHDVLTRLSCRYLYNLVVAIDANFRLKRRAVSTTDRDPPLGSGWGYFVEDGPYLEHVLANASQEDVSACCSC